MKTNITGDLMKYVRTFTFIGGLVVYFLFINPQTRLSF